MHGINSAGRHYESGNIDIRGWNSQVASNSVTRLDNSGQRILSPQHLSGEIEMAIANGLTNARAAHGLAVKRYGGQSMNEKMQFLPESFQQGDITASPIAKMKAASD